MLVLSSLKYSELIELLVSQLGLWRLIDALSVSDHVAPVDTRKPRPNTPHKPVGLAV
jgi:hypothetical protein